MDEDEVEAIESTAGRLYASNRLYIDNRTVMSNTDSPIALRHLKVLRHCLSEDLFTVRSQWNTGVSYGDMNRLMQRATKKLVQQTLAGNRDNNISVSGETIIKISNLTRPMNDLNAIAPAFSVVSHNNETSIFHNITNYTSFEGYVEFWQELQNKLIQEIEGRNE